MSYRMGEVAGERRNELILASQSPRRRALLASLGVDFTVEVADVDETLLPYESPDGLVRRLSHLKAITILQRHPHAHILAADTVVVLDGEVLGKPCDAADAQRMLVQLQGRMHQVYTVVVLMGAGYEADARSASDVVMRDYSDEEVAKYIATGDPMDKAGAYAIQHRAFSPVARWEGCFSAIMGLPLAEVARLMKEAGIGFTIPASRACGLLQEDAGAVCCAAGGRGVIGYGSPRRTL